MLTKLPTPKFSIGQTVANPLDDGDLDIGVVIGTIYAHEPNDFCHSIGWSYIVQFGGYSRKLPPDVVPEGDLRLLAQSTSSIPDVESTPIAVPPPKFNLFQAIDYEGDSAVISGVYYSDLPTSLVERSSCLGWYYTINRVMGKSPEKILNLSSQDATDMVCEADLVKAEDE